MVDRKTLAYVVWGHNCCGMGLTTVAAASALVSREMASAKEGANGRQREPLKPAVQW